MTSASSRPTANALFYLAVLSSLLYWTYLASTTEMVIVHDAVTFQNLGQTIFEKGWTAFFKTGPNREPLYPLLIAASKMTARMISASAVSVQVILQILILAVTQILTYKVLKKIRVKEWVSLASILYLGFSPGIINSSLSGFSEIATYPFILGVILTALYANDSLNGGDTRKIYFYGISTGLLFFLLVSVKAVFGYILPFFLAPYVIAVFRKKNLGKNALIFIVSAALVFNVLIFFYKSLNKKYNGNFVFTDRGSYVLYNCASLRTSEFTGRRYLSALADIPGIEFCVMAFGKKECSFWETRSLEEYSHSAEAESIRASTGNKGLEKAFINTAGKKILKKPFQFAFLTVLDMIKMFFWESTDIGFVVYPGWLEKIYGLAFFKFGLRLIVSLASMAAFFYVAYLTFFNRKNPPENNYTAERAVPVLIITASYVFFYALFNADVGRHLLPIAPLHIILTAISASRAGK